MHPRRTAHALGSDVTRDTSPPAALTLRISRRTAQVAVAVVVVERRRKKRVRKEEALPGYHAVLHSDPVPPLLQSPPLSPR